MRAALGNAGLTSKPKTCHLSGGAAGISAAGARVHGQLAATHGASGAFRVDLMVRQD